MGENTSNEGLVKKEVLAKHLSVSERTIDAWVASKRIPVVRLERKCVRYSIPAVMNALGKFEIKESTR